jgi:murein DD-endopeptidase MepM/ murein hydrolase activator NlpD
MLKKRFYTFIVASHADAKLWRLSLPYPVLAAIGVFAIVGVITAGVASFHYGRMVLKVVDYNNVLTENDTYRSENQNYKIQTAQLGEKIEFLETTAQKLANMTGISSPKAVGGVGGYSKDTLSQPISMSADPLKSIDKYNQSVNSLERNYRELEQSWAERALVEANTPNISPLNGYVTDGFRRRPDPFIGSARDTHTGLDISAPYGSRVYAPADGIVIFVGQRAGYGNIVVIDHKFGYTTRYGHLSKFNVQVGQRVSRYDVLGYVGTSGRTTGPHLHFEVLLYNMYKNPYPFIKRG